MEKIYRYMNEKLKELHANEADQVMVDGAEFRQLYKIVCDVMHIRGIVQDDAYEKEGKDEP